MIDARTADTVKLRVFFAKKIYLLLRWHLCVSKHGVGLGTGYKNDQACANFIHYIGEDQKLELVTTLNKMKFFSIQIDGNTDSANIEEEVFLVMYLDPHAKAGKIHVCDKYLAI